MKKIVSLVIVALMAIGFSGCGGNVGSGSGKDSSNKVTFESIDSDTFKIALERNSGDYSSDILHVAYRIADSDGNDIHLSGLNLKGKKILTCTNSYSSADANTYQCTEETYTFLGKTDKEVRITFYRNKSYIIDMIEYIGIELKEKVTHIKTLQGEY